MSSKPESYDLIVVGAGSAGLTAARFAAQVGARVALIEKERIGGDCTWTGCVPSKALLKVARIAHAARTAGEYGIGTGPIQVEMGKVRDYVQQAIAHVYRWETPAVLEAEGIDVHIGSSRFVDPYAIRVGTRNLPASHFILATGAAPLIPPIPGLNDVRYLTYRHIFDNDRLPQHLLVVGAGPIGVELAQAYRRLGAEVSLIDEALLPEVEPKARELMSRVLAGEGVRFIPGFVTAAQRAGDKLQLRTGDRMLQGDMILLAAGRRANLHGLDLDKAGVAHDEQGIQVDGHLRTTAEHIYAAGDCVGGHQFTHYAGWQGFQAARNALLPGKSKGIADRVPWAVFTDPEIAHFGLGEAEARQTYGDEVQIACWDGEQTDRAVSDNAQMSFIKVVYTTDGALVGATVVSPRAGEVITEFVLAMEHGLKLSDLAQAMHVYPTYAFPVQRLAADVATRHFLDSFVGKTVKRLAGFA